MTSDLASDPTRWQTPSEESGEDECEWSDTFIRQSEWGVGRKGWVSNSIYLLLALFFGGVGAGAALIALYLEGPDSGAYFVAGYVLAVGGKGFFHLLFLGNPLRFWRAVSRPQSSWISRGIIALSIFSVSGLVYMLGPMFHVLPEAASLQAPLAIVCGGLLTFLIVYDGFLLNNATAIGAWNTSLMVVLFPVFSALGGAGLLGALYGPLHAHVALDIHALHQIEAVLLGVGAFALATYLTYLNADPFLRVSAWGAIVGRLGWVFWMVVVVGGIVAPIVVALLSLRAHVAVGLMATTALVAVAGDYAFKYVIFSIGGYRQQYTPPGIGPMRTRQTHGS